MTLQRNLLTGTRFGDVEYTAEDVVTFTEGLIGFSNLKAFVLLCPKPDSAFRWLQSIEEPAVAFLVANPWHYVPDYAPAVAEHQVSSINLDDDTPKLVFTTVTIPAGKPDEMTLNLAGPIVINAEERLAKQLVLEDGAYTIKHRVFPLADRTSEQQAA